MNDDLDRLLREDARRSLPDDGFTSRVLRRLPAHRTRQWSRLQPALIFASAAVGCALAIALSPTGGSLVHGFEDVVRLRLDTPAAISGLATSFALLVSAIILALHVE